MEIYIGKKMIYKFPAPKDISKNYFIGIVDYIGETFITLKDETNIRLKITMKNFHLLEPLIDKISIDELSN